MSACDIFIDVRKANENLCQVNVLCLDNKLALSNAVLVLESRDVHDNLLAGIVQADEQNVLASAKGRLEHFKQELGVVSAVSEVGVN